MTMTKLETQIALDILEHSKRKIGLVSPEKRGLRITKREHYVTLQLGLTAVQLVQLADQRLVQRLEMGGAIGQGFALAQLCSMKFMCCGVSIKQIKLPSRRG